MFLLTLASLWTWSPLGACDAANAISVDQRELARDPQTWFGRCVSLEGFVVQNRFYADVGGFYASVANDREDRRNEGWLGLYLRQGHRPDRLRRATVAGTVSSCTRDYEAAAGSASPDEIIMLTGYCHYTGGLILTGAVMHARGSATFRRQKGQAAQEAFGDLLVSSQTPQPPDAVVELADRFVSAVRHQDAATLATLVTPWSDTSSDDPGAEREFRSFVAGQGRSPFAALRRSGQEVPRTYLVERQSREDVEAEYFPSWHICFCRSGDCTGQWPISSNDADAGPHRPYFCIRAIHDATVLTDPPDGLAVERNEALPE
jgi:hypothetical protein